MHISAHGVYELISVFYVFQLHCKPLAELGGSGEVDNMEKLVHFLNERQV